MSLKLMRASALLDRDPAAALQAAAEILRDDPSNTAASLLLGTAARRGGNAAAALEVLSSLAQSQPDSSVILLELARAYGGSGDEPRAIETLRKAVELQPDLAEAWRELSMHLAKLGDVRGCDVAYGRYTALAPPEPWLLEPAGALAENRLDVAEQLLRSRLQQFPEDAHAMRMLADVAGRRERYDEAENLLLRCLQLVPGYSEARYDLASSLLTQQRPTLVPALIDRLLDADPDNADYQRLRASHLSFIGQHPEALAIYESQLATQPTRVATWVQYGHELKAVGRRADSVNAYRQATTLAPKGGAAYWSLANLKTFQFEPAELDAIRNALSRENLPFEDRVNLEFALGRALENQSQFAESFTHYAAGNALRAAAGPFDSAANSTHVARTRELLTSEFFAARTGWGSDADTPIFIVGLPRSGSTLLEQILASHPQVEGTRELADIANLTRQLNHSGNELDRSAYLQTLSQLSATDVAQLAHAYLEATRIYRRSGRDRFTDKMPNNFLHIGLIHLMFPRAPIIDARRHPLACGFSCFKQNFAAGQWFTNDLQKLGRFYREYVELMGHYDAVLPGRIHRVYYERVVADLEGEVRRLLDSCALPFEQACLQFYDNRRSVQTPSSEQVRRPIFAEGVDHWHHYEPWLGPLKEALGDVIEKY
jgi:tetratricopeptide (TPR) repeat protein